MEERRAYQNRYNKVHRVGLRKVGRKERQRRVSRNIRIEEDGRQLSRMHAQALRALCLLRSSAFSERPILGVGGFHLMFLLFCLMVYYSRSTFTPELTPFHSENPHVCFMNSWLSST